jgi:hypothetical protein
MSIAVSDRHVVVAALLWFVTINGASGSTPVRATMDVLTDRIRALVGATRRARRSLRSSRASSRESNMLQSRLTSSVIVVSLLLAGRSVSAQENNGNPSILKAVQEVQVRLNALASSVDSVGTKVDGIGTIGASVTALQSALTTLQTSVDGLKSASNSNVRVTPPVDIAPPDLASCGLVNVSTKSRTVKTEIVDLNGLVNEGPFTVTLLPGTGNAFGNRTANFFYCRFTVLDGVKADIRAGMSVCTNTVCKQTVAAE